MSVNLIIILSLIFQLIAPLIFQLFSPLICALMLQDLERIYETLCEMSVFCRLRDSELRSLALTLRYQTALANDILFW